MNAITNFLFRNNSFYDFGLLVLRLGIGASMALFHGYGKIIGGPEAWVQYGQSMQRFGIDFFPVFWGFMAGFSEFFCSIFIALGLFFRPATLLLAFTMFVAATYHLGLPADAPNSGFSGASHALEVLTVSIALFFSGPGRYAFMNSGNRG